MSFLDTATAMQDWITTYAVQPLLILFLGVFCGKILEQLLLFLFDQLARKRYTFTFTAYAAKWLVYVLTVAYLLHSINLLTLVLWCLLGIVAVVLCLSIVLGLMDFFPNFLNYHAVQTKHKPGTIIKTRFGEGVVVSTHLTDTLIKMKDGDELYMPNSSVSRFLEK